MNALGGCGKSLTPCIVIRKPRYGSGVSIRVSRSSACKLLMHELLEEIRRRSQFSRGILKMFGCEPQYSSVVLCKELISTMLPQMESMCLRSTSRS